MTTTLGDHAQINVEGVFEPIDDLNTVRDEGLGKFLVTEAGSGPVSMNSKGENEYFKKSFKKRSLESSIPCCFWKDEPKQEIPRWEIEGERGSYQKRPL